MTQSVERFNTSIVIMTLVLSSISTLFVGLLISYAYLNIQSDLKALPVPILFVFNTLLLIGSSIALERANKKFSEHSHPQLEKSLYIALGFTVLFFIFQIIAWAQLIEMRAEISAGINTSFLYVLSGVHLLHVIAGVPFLLFHMYKRYRAAKDTLLAFEYFEDKKNKTILRVLGIYWHFLDILWIVLVLFLYVNYWFRTM